MNKRILYVIVGFSVLVSTLSFYVYNAFFSPNILVKDGVKSAYVYVPEDITFNELLGQLYEKEIVQDAESFAFVAKLMKFQENLKTGRYLLEPKMTNIEAIRLLRSGVKEEVEITFNTLRLKHELAPVVTGSVRAREGDFMNLLHDSLYLSKLGFTEENIIGMFIPNTYKVYWDTDAKGLFQKMKLEYDKFWNVERKQKAEALGLSPIEVITLASIVNEETKRVDERPKVAGLYLNRLKKEMRLEADPTVKYAVGNFELTRVLYEHTETPSPYNTYLNKGLPPGPICMPDIDAIDAVLNPEEHDYIFMCAKGDCSGYHNFAKTNRQHNVNRAIYKKNLRAGGC